MAQFLFNVKQPSSLPDFQYYFVSELTLMLITESDPHLRRIENTKYQIFMCSGGSREGACPESLNLGKKRKKSQMEEKPAGQAKTGPFPL